MLNHMLSLKNYMKGLDIIQSKVHNIEVDKTTDSFKGVVLEDNSLVNGTTCVLTTGTFLRGRIRLGN
jgi:tRNA U34 5-carboxymethylaminomethyl modifying enzyme MnmG/GidA